MCDTATMATLLMTLSNDIETPSFRSISCRQCPVLQDIDGDIAYVLAHSTGRSTEETFTDLTNVPQLSQLQQARNKMFHHAIGAFIECEDPEGFLNDSQFKLKQRRGAKAAATTAVDIVQLFNYVCGIDSNFPSNILANGGQPPPILTAVARDGGNDLNYQSVTDGSTSGSLTLSSLSRSPPDTHREPHKIYHALNDVMTLMTLSKSGLLSWPPPLEVLFWRTMTANPRPLFTPHLLTWPLVLRTACPSPTAPAAVWRTLPLAGGRITTACNAVIMGVPYWTLDAR